MAYTWSGSSAIGFDLARRRGGPAVARVLEHVLRADAGYVTALADTANVPARARIAAAARVDSGDTLLEIDLTDSAEEPGSDPVATLLALSARVRAIRFGDATDLLGLVRPGLDPALDVDPAARAAAETHLRDAVLAALLRAGGPPAQADLADELDAGYRWVGTDRLPAADLGPGTGAVAGLLSAIRAGGSADPLRLRHRPAAPSSSGRWVNAMHVVSWAVELSGRTRPLALAHLALVRVLHAAGFDADDCARGLWNAASGAVAAHVVADLLPDADFELLALSAVG